MTCEDACSASVGLKNVKEVETPSAASCYDGMDTLNFLNLERQHSRSISETQITSIGEGQPLVQSHLLMSSMSRFPRQPASHPRPATGCYPAALDGAPPAVIVLVATVVGGLPAACPPGGPRRRRCLDSAVVSTAPSAMPLRRQPLRHAHSARPRLCQLHQLISFSSLNIYIYIYIYIYI